MDENTHSIAICACHSLDPLQFDLNFSHWHIGVPIFVIFCLKEELGMTLVRKKPQEATASGLCSISDQVFEKPIFPLFLGCFFDGHVKLFLLRHSRVNFNDHICIAMVDRCGLNEIMKRNHLLLFYHVFWAMILQGGFLAFFIPSLSVSFVLCVPYLCQDPCDFTHGDTYLTKQLTQYSIGPFWCLCDSQEPDKKTWEGNFFGKVGEGWQSGFFPEAVKLTFDIL